MRSNWNIVELAGGLAAALIGLALLLDRADTIELEPIDLVAVVMLAAGIAALVVAFDRTRADAGRRDGPRPL
ncbi:hypothetical protein BH20ACT2_BH20ACT2_25680 [soil metagenome]